MNFLFFSAADKALFTRDDAETAEHCHEEMSLNLSFPYREDKEIEHGMRVGFTDSLGVFQAFEVRKPRTLEPEHYQEITAEHIVISELTDEFFAAKDWDNVTASAALTELLTGTLWSVGNVTASGTSSASVGNGYVWPAVKTIEKNWNVYITPRITVSASGITGRYLDIAPAGGTWRGLRFSLEKNLDQVGVAWDDSNLKTALYGFGKQSGDSPLTFADVVWTATADHPAKPSGQTYIEDTAATTAYGRNGRARFGYYQNGDITDPAVLLEKTWETLKTVRVPDVSIDGTVKNLKKLGVVDVPIRLHDTALVEIRPTGVTLAKEVIRFTEDLINPLNDRVTIGDYIPNIIYINRQNSGGGGGSGGQTNEEYRFQANIDVQEGNMQSQINLVVTEVDGQNVVNAANIALAINASGSNAYINADMIHLNGQTIVSGGGGLTAPEGVFTNLYAGPGSFAVEGTDIRAYQVINAEAGLSALDGATVVASNGHFYSLEVGDGGSLTTASWQSKTVVTGLDWVGSHTFEDINGNRYTGHLVETLYTDTIYYLGRVPT